MLWCFTTSQAKYTNTFGFSETQAEQIGETKFGSRQEATITVNQCCRALF